MWKRERDRGGPIRVIPGEAARESVSALDLAQLPDPALSEFETIWNEEWERSITDAALARV